MPAARHDFTLDQGETFDVTLTYKDESDQPIDLTGYSALMKLRSGDGTEVLMLDQTDALTLGDELGTIRILISAAQSAELRLKRYNYELEIEKDDTVTKLLRGFFNMNSEVAY